MNKLAVYSYLTRSAHGPEGSSGLFIEPLPEISWLDPLNNITRQEANRQAGQLFQNLTSGWIQSTA